MDHMPIVGQSNLSQDSALSNTLDQDQMMTENSALFEHLNVVNVSSSNRVENSPHYIDIVDNATETVDQLSGDKIRLSVINLLNLVKLIKDTFNPDTHLFINSFNCADGNEKFQMDVRHKIMPLIDEISNFASQIEVPFCFLLF